jgi:uncharacterized protein
MSNVETVQGLYAAFGRGDLPASLGMLADDEVWESEGPAIISYSGIRHGKAEAAGFFQGLGADHADPKLTIEEYVASGDTVMTLGRYRATAKATGKVFDTPIAHYWKFRDGRWPGMLGWPTQRRRWRRCGRRSSDRRAADRLELNLRPALRYA